MITIYDYFILKIDFLKNNKLLHNQNFKPIILKDKKVYIIEINPRLSTTFAMIVKSGYDPFDNSSFNKFTLNN